MRTITEPGLVRDLSEHDYHADPVPEGSLSSTGAKRLLEAPAVYKWHQDNVEPPKAAYDFGTAVHSLVLGIGARPEFHGFDNLRTNAAKEHVAKMRFEGKVPLSQKEFKEVRACADAVLDHPVAGPLFKRDDGEKEVSAFAKHGDTWLRSRMDLLILKQHLIVDLKTSADDVHPDDFTRTAAKLGYEVSAYHYAEVHELIHGVRPRFIHVAVTKKPPYLVAVHQLDAEFLQLAESRWRRALAHYQHGKATGEWPGIPPTVHQISPPLWAIRKEEAAQEATQ